MEHSTVLATAGALALLAGTALAANTNAFLHNSSDGSSVTLSGTVEKVTNSQEFTLRDDKGSFEVTIPAGNEAILNEGDSVSVTGSLGNHNGDFDAYSISVNQRADL